MISYGKQSIDQKDIDSVVEVLKGDWLTQGPLVEEFEKELNQYFGSLYACAVTNGTAALHLAGKALGWRENDIVITSPITFLASANSIIYNNAIPQFVDIDKKTYTIDPNQVEDKVKENISNGLCVKAIIGVDYAGHPCDWVALRSIADRYGLQLVNDNCHAMGAKLLRNQKYAVSFADVVTQSYHPVKHITTGEGGSILTNDERLNEKVKCLRSHGMVKEKNKIDDQGPWYYEMHEIGFNYRITDFQCALGISQLKKLNSFVKSRTEISKKYNNYFKDHPFLKIPHIDKSVDHAFHLYPIQIDFKGLEIEKKIFFKNMMKDDIQLQVHYIPVHLQPYYKFRFGFKRNDFPYAERFYAKEISLPIYPSLSDSQVQKVAKTVLKHLNSD